MHSYSIPSKCNIAKVPTKSQPSPNNTLRLIANNIDTPNRTIVNSNHHSLICLIVLPIATQINMSKGNQRRYPTGIIAYTNIATLSPRKSFRYRKYWILSVSISNLPRCESNDR